MASEYIVQREVAVDCLKKLKEKDRRVHVFFPAYLAIYRTMREKGKAPGDFFAVDFEDFYNRYLEVPGSPKGESYPWINPFEDKGDLEYNLWRKTHLAGSFGGSIKEGLPLSKVAAVTGTHQDIRYSLRESHPALAREHLLRGTPVPAHLTALFFLRDFCIETDEPRVARWVQQFQQDFGFLANDGQANEAFEYLFSLPEDFEDLDEKADDFFRECPPSGDEFSR